MFQHLLVPLDGSRLAESALPMAARIASKMGALVTLIHIIEQDAPKEVHKDRHLTEPEEARHYLEEVAQRAFPDDVQVDWHVHTSEVKNVARGIYEHTEELAPDLVVMCSHGRGGPRDWLLGSIAQQVISLGKTPVLLVPPHDEGDSSFPCGLALVPLDGQADHEQGLAVAKSLALPCGMNLYLLMVIPTLSTLKAERAATGRMLPGAMTAMLDLAEQGGKDYLTRHLEALRQAEIPARAEVARGDPAAAILEVSRRVNADLIILGTHGKAGMDAFWSGSITPKLSGHAEAPLLLVPVREE